MSTENIERRSLPRRVQRSRRAAPDEGVVRGLDRPRSAARTWQVFVMGNAIEILRAFDFQLVFPEINSLQTGVKRSPRVPARLGGLRLLARRLSY